MAEGGEEGMKFIASYEHTFQVTEDSWRVGLRTLMCDENTTIGEIKDWYSKSLKVGPAMPMDDLRISEPAEKKP